MQEIARILVENRNSRLVWKQTHQNFATLERVLCLLQAAAFVVFVDEFQSLAYQMERSEEQLAKMQIWQHQFVCEHFVLRNVMSQGDDQMLAMLGEVVRVAWYSLCEHAALRQAASLLQEHVQLLQIVSQNSLVAKIVQQQRLLVIGDFQTVGQNETLVDHRYLAGLAVESGQDARRFLFQKDVEDLVETVFSR